METDRASLTALITAFNRAFHHEHDKPKIFEDRLAGQLFTERERAQLEELLLSALKTNNPESAAAFSDRLAALRWIMQTGASAPILLARARYAEEMLEIAIREGISQYVILGAGLDTFAHRRPDLSRRISTIEVDHPATQAHKRQRLAELNWQQPDGLHYVPVDFTCQSLTAALASSPFNPELPTFFSWLGVTYYLSRSDVNATLRQIATVAPSGSYLVFDYLDVTAYHCIKAAPRVTRMLQAVAQIGEPMQSGFDPERLGDELAAVGLELSENLSPHDIHIRYFMGRTDHYRACEHAYFASARVV